MASYGYARVSTLDLDLTIQRAALKAAGCGVVRAEKASGSRRDGRTELQVLLDFVQPGDTLVVTRISMRDLQDIVHELKGRGVALRAIEQPVDTGTAAGKAFLDMLGVFAEFETNLRRERQLEGIALAKTCGVYKGRKPSIDTPGLCRRGARLLPLAGGARRRRTRRRPHPPRLGLCRGADPPLQGADGLKQHLAAIRMLFDWLIVSQVVCQNPAAAVREPKYVVKKGKTPVLDCDEAKTCSPASTLHA
jgi:DNA invertase Pin-like site-specific DNA recombinase